MPAAGEDLTIALGDRRLQGFWIGSRMGGDGTTPTLVFLHEGLGSIAQWRDFPQRLCRLTGCSGVVYERTGYGRSSPWPTDPDPRYMEIEADLVLPAVVDAMGIAACVLIGHSDGGTIALNYAALEPAGLRGVATIGAHVVNEPRSLASIRQACEAFHTGDLRARLARYHGPNVDGAFRVWSDAWLSAGFEPMDAGGRLPRVRVPVLALQGEDDEYGTRRQLDTIAASVGGPCETALIAGCGHSPHLEEPEPVADRIARFVRRLQ